MDLVWKPWLLALGLLLSWSGLSAQDWSKITLELQDQLEVPPAAPPYYKAYVLLADRVDIRALEAEFRAQQTPVDERARQVARTLQEKAAATQPAVTELLERTPGVEAASLDARWISNMIFFKGTRAAILQLTQHPGIASIGYNAPVEWEEAEQAPVPPPPSPNGIEPGLAAIDAPGMWAMGYTGYGTRALIVDTGTDPGHPALTHQNLYNLQPGSTTWAGTDYLDCDGHGTHVAGTVLGLDHTTRDTIGVAFEAKWMSGIALGGYCNPGTDISGIYGMYQFALNPDGDLATTDDIPDVINNSWRAGSYDCDASGVIETYDALYAAGIAVVFAAGNDGPAPSSITPPKFNNWDLVRLFAVGNLNANGQDLNISPGSSRGPSICGGSGSLLIKPEVSAPGSSIRSAYLDGEYAFLSGTSMAAPHASGAILLLKEAFPFLTGEDLMLALYHSATDLGAPGEDNNYGMGIINVPAAFDYLVDQGHTPVPPRSYEGNARLIRLETADFNCNSQALLTAIVEFAGPGPLNTLDIEYKIGPAAPESYTWTGEAMPGELVYIELPAITLPEGAYEVEATITAANGTADDRPEDNTMKTDLRVLDQVPISAEGPDLPVCSGGAGLFQAFAGEGAIVRWFNAPEGGAWLGTGSEIAIDLDQVGDAVYAQAVKNTTVGRPDTTGSAVVLSNQQAGLRFDAFHGFQIESVEIYAEETGGRLIQLVRPDGSVVSRIVPIREPGKHRVDIGLSIEPGEGYLLRLEAGKPLARNTGDFQGYPLPVPGIMEITGSSSSPFSYPYFYNWVITYEDRCGRVRVPVAETNAPAADELDFTASADTVDLASGATIAFDAPVSPYTGWAWHFGDGSTGAGPSVAHTFTEPGNYLVLLTARSGNTCSQTVSRTITVTGSGTPSETTAPGTPDAALSVFPNPTEDQLFVSLEGLPLQMAELTVVDLTGRPVAQLQLEAGGAAPAAISTRQWPNGSYLVIVKTQQGQFVQRIVKAK